MENFICKHDGKKFDSKESLEQHMRDVHSKKEIVEKKKLPLKNYVIFIAVFLIIIAISYGIYSLVTAPQRIGPLNSQHIHADFKLYLNGQVVDFSQNKYQLGYGSQDNYVHMENGNGNVIHVHATGIIIDDWLNSIKIHIDSNCLTMDNGTNYCSSQNKTLKMFIESCSAVGTTNTTCSGWQQVAPTGNYTIQDLDKILISYGSDNSTTVTAQQNSVTNEAIIESKGNAAD
jgi:hypothetical protein